MASYWCPPANPMTSPEASTTPVKHSKTSTVKTLQDPFHKSQDSVRSLVRQFPGYMEPSPFQPKTCYCLNFCPLPPAPPLTPESPVPSRIPEATGVYLPADGLTELQLIDHLCASRKSLSLVMVPPTKPPYEVTKRQKNKTQHRSKKKRDKEVLGFSLNLVPSNSDLPAPDTPENLPLPEATEVTIPDNPC